MRYPRRGALGFLAVLVAWAAFAPAAVAATSPGSVVTISFGEGVASAATAGSSPQIAGKVASIGFVADLHAGCTAWLPDQLSAFRDHLQGLGLDDVIFAGDILNNDVDQVTFLETYNASFSGAMALSAPHYELNGNHDEPMHPFLNSFTLDAGSLRFIGFVMNYVVTDLGTFGSMTQDMIDSVDARLAAAVALYDIQFFELDAFVSGETALASKAFTPAAYARVSSGLSRRNCRTFSRPWPSR